MKKLLSIILSISMAFSLSATAFAAENNSSSPLPTPPINADGVIELTEEYIQQYGIPGVDEFGNNIIEVPIGPASSEGDIISEAPDTTCDDIFLHEGHTSPAGFIQPYHFSLTPHSHEIINLVTLQYSNFVPATQYAMAGFTVTKEYSRSVEINASLNLAGGISKGSVEGQLGVSVGGSYSRGSSESYSAVVPSGYRGRIAYRYYSNLYLFDNKTTYIWSSFPLVTTEEIDACSAESAPYDGYFYLQLLAIN